MSPWPPTTRERALSQVRARCAATLVLGALVCVACGGTPSETGGAASSAASGADEGSVAESSAPDRGPLGSGEAVTIAFAGDSSFEGVLDRLEADPTGLLSAIAPVLGAADVSVVNLEAALATGGQPEAKAFTFRVPPTALDALGAAGTDVVTMANNHGMDFGAAGLEESLEIRDGAAVGVIGIGRDAADAYSPFVTEVRGQRIGVIAANDVFDSSVVGSWTATDDQPGIASSKASWQDRLLDAVRTLRGDVDTLAVYLHFGVERDTCPTARQQELVAALTDAGADIVVGSHPHRLQGIGFHDGRLVAYSLSNFVFRAGSPEGSRTGVLTVTATGRRIDGYEWAPAMIRNGLPEPLSGSAADEARRTMEQLRDCTGLSASPVGDEAGDQDGAR